MNPNPDTQSIEPALLFEVTFTFPRGKQVPLGFTVAVRSEDRRLLGIASPVATPIVNAPDSLPLDASANENAWNLTVQAFLPLTPRQLDYVEDVRAKHRKRDVVLHCDVEAHCLTSKVVNTPLKPGSKVNPPAPDQFVTYAEPGPGGPFYSQISNMWVLSGDGGRTFLQREKLYHPMVVTIRASDWVHDYLAPWRRTRYVVVELPQAEVLTASSRVEERVNSAIEAANKASENVTKGEWNDVLEDLRPVWELLRNDSDIQGLLQRDGYTPEAVTAFNESVKHQFELASKFIHRTDKSGKNVAPEIRASKEDALVCYSFALSLLNLVSRKALRLRSP